METMGAFDGVQTHDWPLMSKTLYPLHHAAPQIYIDLIS